MHDNPEKTMPVFEGQTPQTHRQSESPLVSAIITTHNRGCDFLLRAVSSVLSQTYSALELLIVDDSDSDYSGRAETAAIVKEIAASAPFPVMYITTGACNGLAAARNLGISRSSGTCLAFLDDDDEWLPGKTACQVAAFLDACAEGSTRPGLVYGPAYITNDDTGETELMPVRKETGAVYEKLLSGNWIGYPSFVLFAKEAVLQAGMFDPAMPYMEDYDLYLRVTEISGVVFVSEPLGVYHDHSGEQMTKNPEKYLKALQLLDGKYRRNYEKLPTVDRKRSVLLAGALAEQGKRKKAMQVLAGARDRGAIKGPEFFRENIALLTTRPAAGRKRAAAPVSVKRILVVHCPRIVDFPPVRSLLETLLALNYSVTLITKDPDHLFTLSHPSLRVIHWNTSGKGGPIGNLVHFSQQAQLRTLVRALMKNHDLLWTTTDTTVRELGDELLRYPHIMQLLELVEDIPRIPGYNNTHTNLQKYARNAVRVVVPEYNRARIQQTWWQLETCPVVLPNKPYRIPDAEELPPDWAPYAEKMQREQRRILLYQGVFYEDRKLDAFAQAVSLHQDTYVLYIMGKKNDLLEEFLKKYPFAEYIPFLPSPLHLCITRYADIGLLPYIPVKTEHYSSLNALYCAPNKIYEYAAFGLPMIGSDVIGLSQPFEAYHMGVCCRTLTPSAVLEALKVIEQHGTDMQQGGKQFFAETDLKQIVAHEILGGF